MVQFSWIAALWLIADAFDDGFRKDVKFPVWYVSVSPVLLHGAVHIFVMYNASV